MHSLNEVDCGKWSNTSGSYRCGVRMYVGMGAKRKKFVYKERKPRCFRCCCSSSIKCVANRNHTHEYKL